MSCLVWAGRTAMSEKKIVKKIRTGIAGQKREHFSSNIKHPSLVKKLQ
jgi:hypothetical protein